MKLMHIHTGSIDTRSHWIAALKEEFAQSWDVLSEMYQSDYKALRDLGSEEKYIQSSLKENFREVQDASN